VIADGARKQVYELTTEDLEATPGEPVPAGGMFVVRTRFTLATGERRSGYLYYTPELPAGAGPNYGPLANRQPYRDTGGSSDVLVRPLRGDS
jgi:hypothetical protein